jgi:hypothetical protein
VTRSSGSVLTIRCARKIRTPTSWKAETRLIVREVEERMPPPTTKQSQTEARRKTPRRTFLEVGRPGVDDYLLEYPFVRSKSRRLSDMLLNTLVHTQAPVDVKL